MTPPITFTESPKVQTTQNSVVETQQEQLKGRSGFRQAAEPCICGRLNQKTAGVALGLGAGLLTAEPAYANALPPAP